MPLNDVQELQVKAI